MIKHSFAGDLFSSFLSTQKFRFIFKEEYSLLSETNNCNRRLICGYLGDFYMKTWIDIWYRSCKPWMTKNKVAFDYLTPIKHRLVKLSYQQNPCVSWRSLTNLPINCLTYSKGTIYCGSPIYTITAERNKSK